MPVFAVVDGYESRQIRRRKEQRRTQPSSRSARTRWARSVPGSGAVNRGGRKRFCGQFPPTSLVIFPAFSKCAVSPSFAEFLEESSRVKDIGPGLLQPPTNCLCVDLGDIAEHGLRRLVLADRLEIRFVECPPIPKQKINGLGRRVVADHGIVIGEPDRAAVPYLGTCLRKGRVDQLAQEIAHCPKCGQLGLRVRGDGVAIWWVALNRFCSCSFLHREPFAIGSRLQVNLAAIATEPDAPGAWLDSNHGTA